MKIELSFNYIVELHDCKLDSLIAAFKQMILPLLSAFISTVLRQFADRLFGNMAIDCSKEEELSIPCSKCGGHFFNWKTRASKSVTATVATCLGVVSIPQMQVQCKKCGHKQYVVRSLLNLLPYARLSAQTERQLALCGSLTSFRVSEVFARVFGGSFTRSTVWRCVQKVGKSMSFAISPDECPEAQADGTGIPIKGIPKRGKELKVMIQKNTAETATNTRSRWRLAGLGLGDYNGSWENLFRPSLEAIRSFKSFLLSTDGDEGIRKALGNLTILLQRCLWHIPHQLKYCLWKDGIAKTSGIWKTIMGKTYQLAALRQLLEEDEIEALIDEKKNNFNDLLDYCRKQGCKKSVSYLENAEPDMFTALRNRLDGKATSQVERVMRTVNLRINYGKWSIDGALNAMKIRLAFYYNGYDPSRNEPNKSDSTSKCRLSGDGKKT